MLSLNKHGIIIRLVLGAIFSALVIGLIASQLLFQFTIKNQKALGLQAISQLSGTVSPTSSVAVYVNDKELASEVINGLVSNNLVKHAAIKTDAFLVSSEQYNEYINASTKSEHLLNAREMLTIPIYSPFEDSRQLGTLDIVPNFSYIEKMSADMALRNLIIVVVMALATIASVTLLVHLMITRPLMKIQGALNKIIPGDKKRLLLPKFHRYSELGVLVQDANKLLDKTEHQINQERDLRSEIEVTSERFQMVFERAVTGMVLTDEKGTLLLSNQAFEALIAKIGVSKKSSFGPFMQELFERPKEIEEVLKKALINREIVTGEFKLKGCNSQSDQEVWVALVFSVNTTDDYRDYLQFNFTDISHSKLRLEELDRLANYDQLTGIMNRQAAESEVSKLIERKYPFSLILLDLNDFKPINDIYGHNVGDEVLIHVAKSLQSIFETNDFCARWGGDEFLIICHVYDKKSLQAIADIILNKIKTPYYVEQQDEYVSVGASLGCVTYQQDDVDLLSLIKLADEAMYSLKAVKDTANPPAIRFADEI